MHDITNTRSNVKQPYALYMIAVFCLICLGLNDLRAQTGLPDVNVKTLEGQVVNIKNELSPDKVTVLSFWATWCAPCKLELDAISEIYEEWQDEYEVELIAVSVDDARALAKVGPMVAEKDWPFKILTDSNQDLMRLLSFQSIPYTLVINQAGEIAFTHTGYLPGDEETLEEEIMQLQQ